MAKSGAERSREWRRRQGVTAKRLAPCGTRAAAERHRRNGEPVCGSCLQAERTYMREAARNRK